MKTLKVVGYWLGAFVLWNIAMLPVAIGIGILTIVVGYFASLPY